MGAKRITIHMAAHISTGMQTDYNPFSHNKAAYWCVDLTLSHFVKSDSGANSTATKEDEVDQVTYRHLDTDSLREQISKFGRTGE